MFQVAITSALVLMGAAAACAQETVTLEIRFAHPVLAPGQTQQVEVWASFAPGLGTMVPWTTPPGQGQLLPVWAFGSAYFDLLNLTNAQTGSYSNLSVNPNLNVYGVVGIPQPNGDVTEILAAQVFVWTSQNPVQLWTAEWARAAYDPRTVTLETRFLYPPQVLLGLGTTFPAVQEWTGIEAQGSFHVIPSPGTLPVLALAGLLAARRRRYHHPTHPPMAQLTRAEQARDSQAGSV